jgi:3'-phosphoadenosine 5'-phosphosulfate (PAPS) 3'-phosphatase
MTIQEITKRSQAIKKRIQQEIISDLDIAPITDGIIDIKKYVSSQYKILWILKEPYDGFDEDGNPSGGGWDIADAINPKTTFQEFGGGKPTFKPMIYTCWGILNGFCLWNDMEHVENDPTMLEALKSIAYINVKKLPGNTTSRNNVIEDAYQQHKGILLQQIRDYEPDIVIGGSTLPYLFADLGISAQLQKHNTVNYAIKDNKIFIDAYHPSQRMVKQDDYCNDIITAVQLWANGRSSKLH